MKVDFENIGQRILSMPLPPREYVGLQVGKPGVLFALETQPRRRRGSRRRRWSTATT